MQKGETVGTDWVSASLRRQVRINALVCALCAAALILPIQIKDQQLQSAELYLSDSLTEQRGGGTADSRMVLIGIDDASLNVLDILDEDVVEAHPGHSCSSWRMISLPLSLRMCSGVPWMPISLSSASRRISKPSTWSATIRLSRAFSFSSPLSRLSRLAWLTSIIPNSLFYR